MSLTREQKTEIVKRRQAGATLRQLAKTYGVSHERIRQVAKLEKIKDRVRNADEFTAESVTAPRKDRPTLSWMLQTIRGARDAQMMGDFTQPVALARMMRSDDAIFVAYHNRIAPQAAIATELIAAPGARGEAVARKAASSCITPRSVMQGLCGTLANHGIAIGYIKQEVSDDGTRTDFELTEWPLEHVKYNYSTEQLETRQLGGPMLPIIHGDGRWVVFKKFSVEPWSQEACVIPAAMIWASHAEGLKDWNQATAAHGRSKVIGELPEGVSIQNDGAGAFTAEASAFLDMLQSVVSGESGAGLRPFNAKTEWVSNGSSAWQVFLELVSNREKAAARVYLGTDATMGSVGGAPGVDIAQLFGVATTKIQGDFEALEQGLFSGLFQPWAAVNEGDSRRAPRLRYLLPDTDSQKETADFDLRLEKLMARVKELKEQSFVIDQPMVDRLCKTYNVDPPIVLAPGEVKTTAIIPTPSGFESSMRVKEMRAAGGLAPTGDPQIDEMFMPQFAAFLESSGNASGAASQPGQQTPPGAAPPAEPAPAADPKPAEVPATPAAP